MLPPRARELRIVTSTRSTVLCLCALATASLAACGGDGGTAPIGPETLVKVDGDQQSGVVAEALSVDPTVEVRGADGDPVAGVSVEFEVTSGSGSVPSGTTTTNSQGRASTTWTLGTSVDVSQALQASAGSLTATFSADPEAGPPATVEIISGDDQEVSQPGTRLPDPLVVEVSDSYGNPVEEGIMVQFATDNGSVSPSEDATDGTGRARTTATVGSESDLAPVSVFPASLLRARETVLYGKQLEAAQAALFTATVSQLTPVDFSARVGGTAMSGSWSVSQGSTPPGITLSTGGLLEGVPSGGGAGDYTFTVEASDGGSTIATWQYTLTVCEPPLQLAPGESTVENAPPSGSCGLFLPAGTSGDRYRVGVLWATTNSSTASSQVDLSVQRHEAAATTPPAIVAVTPTRAPAGASGSVIPGALLRSELETLEATERVHRRIREADRRLMAELGSAALLPSRDAALAPGAARAAAPESRDFYAPARSCQLADTELVRANLIRETDHIVAYQDSVQRTTNPVDAALINRMSEYYAMYGAPVIQDYFGGTSDIDGNGKLIVFVTEPPEDITTEAAAFVLGRDLFSRSECAASNEAEMTYFSANVILAMDSPTPTFQALGTLVHEVKHISSLYNRIQSGSSFEDWIEEGTADIAAEVSSRRAWADSGGPAVDATMTREDFPSGTAITAANWGVVLRMARLINTLSEQPNALTENPIGADAGHTFYGSSWHFHRFLGDAYYGGTLSEAAFFRRQNEATSGGVTFLENELGKALETLEEEMVLGALVNGTPAQGSESVTRTFSGYEFSSAAEIFCAPNPLGVYPWTLTTTGERSQGDCTEGYDPGAETQDPSAAFVTATYSGQLGAGGIRAHGFQSDGTGQGIEINVDVGSPATAEVRVVVVRIE